MTPAFDRRSFIKAITAASSASILSIPGAHAAKIKARVVVIGGGYGGATAAKYLRVLDPGIEVTLIERETLYTSCPLSNEVISGDRDIKTLQVGYKGLLKRGVKVVHDEVTSVDTGQEERRDRRRQAFATMMADHLSGRRFQLCAGGRAFRGAGAHKACHHAWKAGPQTLLLKKQLEAMPDGGTFIIAVPKGPFRCPPGPYERAAQVAMYCKHHGKAKSKVLILDANDSFSKKPLFEQAWKELYGYGPGGMIEWIPGASDGTVKRIDSNAMTCYTATSASTRAMSSISSRRTMPARSPRTWAWPPSRTSGAR
jgi:sulfide dehydrogenase [flavocytochrome c] flavoprotein subunit